jgi:hypothetical protein
MATQKLNLTRDQLSSFLDNFEQVKQFESLFQVTTSANLTDQIAHSVYAGPISGAAQQPQFRLLVKNDIPQLDYVESVGATAPITSTGGFNPVIGVTGSALTRTNDTNVTVTLGGSPTNALLSPVSLALGWNGQLSVDRGGTGQSSFTDGELLIGNSSGNTLSKAVLTAGANITIINSPGGITISAAAAPSGVTATITTASLTLGGSNGSMTFTNGILTAQTQAT